MKKSVYYRALDADNVALYESDDAEQTLRQMPEGGSVWKIVVVTYRDDLDLKVAVKTEKRIA